MSKWTKIVEIYKEFPKLSTVVKNIKNILKKTFQIRGERIIRYSNNIRILFE